MSWLCMVVTHFSVRCLVLGPREDPATAISGFSVLTTLQMGACTGGLTHPLRRLDKPLMQFYYNL